MDINKNMISEEQIQEQTEGRKFPNPVWLLVVAILTVVSFGFALPEPAAGVLGVLSYELICTPVPFGVLYGVLSLLFSLGLVFFCFFSWWLALKNGNRLCYNTITVIYAVNTIVCIVFGRIALVITFLIRLLILFLGLKVHKIGFRAEDWAGFESNPARVAYIISAVIILLITALLTAAYSEMIYLVIMDL